MSDYEILMIGLTFTSIVVSLLIAYIKNNRPTARSAVILENN